MKKIITLLFAVVTLNTMAQPVIDGKYLPVVGTAFDQIWDTVTASLTIPNGGINQTWDYSNQFVNALPTVYRVETFLAAGGPHSQYFPGATHRTFATIPFNTIQDSAWTYFVIDHAGLHNLGAFCEKQGYDSTIITNPTELNLPFTYQYGSNFSDTSKSIAFLTLMGFPVRVEQTKTKQMVGYGYGTLKLPIANYNNVLLVKETINTIDSIYVDFGGGIYTYYQRRLNDNLSYRFFRNNTFGSNILMSMNTDIGNNNSWFGYYILPFDIGTISGTVRDSGQAFTPITNGTALLYREHGNFSKDDILDTAPLDANGNYTFDSIPYGQYRIAVRPDLIQYPNALTTYYGDSVNWLTATLVTTFNMPAVTGIEIQLSYPTPSVALGHAIGHLYLDYAYSAKVQAAQPIPGIDISAKKNPGGVKSQIMTNGNGQFDLTNLADGVYDLYVDIPGLEHYSTYTITITGGNTASNLNFTVNEDSIYAGADLVYINNHSTNNSSAIVYPNPFNETTTISVTLAERGTVSLEVFNLLGEKVSTLENNVVKAAGNYKYDFTTTNPSGIYFVKLNVNGVPNTFKIVKE